jgi:hypothetical protein
VSSPTIAELKHKIGQLEAAALSRRSDPDPSGSLISLEKQVTEKLSLENVDIGPIIEALKSVERALESLEVSNSRGPTKP